MSIARLKDYRGPALFSYGFRPFFFFGSVYAGAVILVWLPAFYGTLQLGTAFAPRDWHVHEMLFGYIAAVVAGFLLTAVPNWTGRLPLQGRPLCLLFSTWVAGRIAVSVSAWIGWGPAAAIDSLFLILLAAAAAREIIAGRKWGNLQIIVIVSVLAGGNLAFHLEAHRSGLAEYSTRGGVAMVIVLIALIGGRIIPSFTRNWLARQAPGHMPSPFGRFDAVTMTFTVFVLALWVARPLDRTTGGLLLACGLMHIVRLVRWTGYRTFADRLVLILHVAYAVHPGRFHPLRALGARPHCGKRRDPRLDGRRDRHHDARRDEPGNARSHRAAAGSVRGDASDLRVGHRRCSGEGLRGAGSRSHRHVAVGCRYCLGCGISRICRRLFGGVLVAAPVLTSDKAFI